MFSLNKSDFASCPSMAIMYLSLQDRGMANRQSFYLPYYHCSLFNTFKGNTPPSESSFVTLLNNEELFRSRALKSNRNRCYAWVIRNCQFAVFEFRFQFEIRKISTVRRLHTHALFAFHNTHNNVACFSFFFLLIFFNLEFSDEFLILMLAPQENNLFITELGFKSGLAIRVPH